MQSKYGDDQPFIDCQAQEITHFLQPQQRQQQRRRLQHHERPLSAIEDLFHLFYICLLSSTVSLILIVELFHLFCSDGNQFIFFGSEWTSY